MIKPVERRNINKKSRCRKHARMIGIRKYVDNPGCPLCNVKHVREC